MNDERKMVERMFNSMAGLNGAATSSVFTSAVGGLRNLMTSAMLGTSVLTATSDQAIMRANARALGFTRDGMRLSANTIRNLFSGDAKNANAELGLLVDSHAAVVSKMGGIRPVSRHHRLVCREDAEVVRSDRYGPRQQSGVWPADVQKILGS